MAANVPVAFSPNGEYLAYSSPDGTLKIWEAATGTLKQEYTPSSHLSATCTCLTWCPVRQTTCVETPKKKKRRSSRGQDRLDLIALGTTSGTVLLYSLVSGDLHSQLSGGHSGAVNSVCWGDDAETLYSCSTDQHIIEWSLSTAKIKHKWKGDRSSVHSICVCQGNRNLLSAGRTIKLWDLDTRECIKTFTGHATEVFRILFVSSLPSSSSQNGASALNSVENSYFLTAAHNDRLINAWQITSSKDKNALASFALPDDPVCVDISQTSQKDQPTLLAAVTKSGQLLVFEHLLNGKCKKPLRPKITVQIATEGSKEDVPQPLPILAVHLCVDQQQNVLLAHGNFLKPTLEKLPYKSLDGDVCLVREAPTKSKILQDRNVTKVVSPDTSQEVTVLGPGHMAPCGPKQAKETPEGKKIRKKRKSISQEMSMEERLNAISIDKPGDGRSSTHPPTADKLAHLLTQGLQSQDKKILNNVLQNRDDIVIRNTVKCLPVQVIIPLVEELSKRMHGHAQIGHTLVKWIKTVLTLHTSYLMTCPELVDSFSSLYQMMDSRVSVFSRLSRLQGKLDLVLSQISSQAQEEEDVGAQQAMLVYQDESSDEDILDGDMLQSASDSDGNWEDESDMDVSDADNQKDDSGDESDEMQAE